MLSKCLKVLFVLCFCLSASIVVAAEVSYSANADITSGDKTFKLSDNVLTISMSRPAKPMKPFDISLKFEKQNVSKVYFAANMVAMNMGRFLKVFQPDMKNTMITQMVLPKCGSGNTLWYGKLDIVYTTGNIETMYFFFDLK